MRAEDGPGLHGIQGFYHQVHLFLGSRGYEEETEGGFLIIGAPTGAP